ncbi:DinB family protein [Kordia sp.]|uniref:DinB family protein n=1 Tax=Kordia sp. TaxID=1965332 RepID=UPI003D268445
MEEKNNLEELVTYNLWANKRLLNWLKTNDKKLLTKQCTSSFPSIITTVHHILDGQLLYYCILNEQPLKSSLGNSIEEIFNELIEQSEAFVNYVKAQKSLNAFRSVKTKNLDGNFHQFELIQHCMNHSTFHRGQLVTIGHQLKFTKAPSTDMLFYFIQRNKIHSKN